MIKTSRKNPENIPDAFLMVDSGKCVGLHFFWYGVIIFQGRNYYNHNLPGEGMSKILVLTEDPFVTKEFKRKAGKMALQFVSPPLKDLVAMVYEMKPLCLLIDTRVPRAEWMLRAFTRNGFRTPVMVFSSEVSARATFAAARRLYLSTLAPDGPREGMEGMSDSRAGVSLVGSERIVGESPALVNVLKTVEKVAKTDSNVLICGESGTGKELIARLIHENSPRTAHPFIPVDCAALPESLLESELFGFERGAFTDAYRTKHGIFEYADEGTLFLDEVGEIPLQMQSKLLRVLQERQIRRVGGRKLIRVDVRIISATNRDLVQAMDEKEFRQDLFYRLNVISIYLPPLRERRGDVSLLVDHFLRHYCGVFDKTMKFPSQAALALMEEYPWPGNVRELQNVIERAVALSEEKSITPEDLPPRIREMAGCGPPSFDLKLPFEEAKNRLIEAFEKKYLQNLMEMSGGNVSLAARTAGVNRKTVHRLLKKHGFIK